MSINRWIRILRILRNPFQNTPENRKFSYSEESNRVALLHIAKHEITGCFDFSIGCFSKKTWKMLWNKSHFFNVIAENQPVVFAKQSYFYQQCLKAKSDLKESRDREINTKSLYWFTLYQELHSVLRNLWEFTKQSNTLITQIHQSGDLEPFKNTHHLWQKDHRSHNNLLI